MTYQIIPRQRVQGSSEFTDVELDGMVMVLPAGLGEQARNHLDDCDAVMATAMTTLETKHATLKRDYVRIIKGTYDTLMQAIQAAQAGNKKLRCTIIGSYGSSFSTPSLAYWSQCNPGKITAINYVISNLRLNGWQPEALRISEFTVDHDDGMYSGGNEVIITCDFTEH